MTGDKAPMEEQLDMLRRAYEMYREELEAAERKQKPTDGLLGFGRSLKDDACHERFDERVAQAVSDLCDQSPESKEAERAIRLLLLRERDADWQLSAQWMLRAAERHSLALIGFLERADAEALQKAYAARYKPWDRLPVQKQVLQALKARARG